MDRIEVKFATNDIDAASGAFAGYGSVFGNVDSYGDVVVPGAFNSSLKGWRDKGRFPSMKLMHGAAGNPFASDDLPIGVWTMMREDDRGLYVEGKLSALDSDMGRRVYGLMKDGALNGLSIGYRVKRAQKAPGGATFKRSLEEIDLIEVSVVDMPANDRARVSDLKRDLAKDDIRELEAALRTLGLSRSDAVKAVSGFREFLQRDAVEPNNTLRDEGVAALAEQIRKNLQLLT